MTRPNIRIPDFRKMPDYDLHGWEFELYERFPDRFGDLRELVGRKATRDYYAERARRLDLDGLKRVEAELQRLEWEAASTRRRLGNGTSLRAHFRGVLSKK